MEVTGPGGTVRCKAKVTFEEPTPTPTEPPPTPAPKPVETEPKVEVETCKEEDVRLYVSNGQIWRYWMDDSTNTITRELLLTNDRLKDAISSEPSVDPSGCWYVASVTLPNETQSDLWIVSTSGEEHGSVTRVMNTTTSEVNPNWDDNGVIRYSMDGKLLYTHMNFNPQWIGVDGDFPTADLVAERIAFIAPDQTLAFFLTSDSSNVVTTTITAEGPIDWSPNGSSITFQRKNETCELDLNSDPVNPTINCSVWDNLAYDPRIKPSADIAEQQEQLVAVERSPQKEVQLFAALQVGVALAIPQELEPDRPRTQPTWWHEAEGRSMFDSNIAEQFLTTNTSSATQSTATVPATTTATPSAPVCAGYDGNSIVDCLVAAGMDSSFGARAQMAVDNGLIASIDQYDPATNGPINWDLLNILRGDQLASTKNQCRTPY